MTGPTAGQPETAAAPVSAPGSPRRRWRNFVLDPGLQLRLGGYLAAVASGLSLALGVQLWRAYREASRLVALGDGRADEVVSALLRGEDRRRMAALAVVLAFIVVALVVLSIVVTHRIAGPAHAIGRTCRAVGEGSLRRARPLRRGDLLAGLATEVTAMIDALRAREEAERVRLEEAAGASPERARQIAAELAAEKARRLG
jgi:methyl-accepting chemotaxis protein